MKTLFFLLLALILFVPHAAFAQENATAAAAPSIEYTLPYPGILPGSPFYFLKTFRDKVISILITDPKKQAEFDLLQADKRLAATEYLLRSRPPKTALAIDTLSKGENYFFFAVENASIAKKEHIDVNGLLDTMLTASQKHKEIILQLLPQVPQSSQVEFLDQVRRVDDIAKQVTSVKQKR